MTDKEMNWAIAEFLGWKSVPCGWFCSQDGGVSGWGFAERKQDCEERLSKIKETDWRHGSTIHPQMTLPPKYSEDLNLMREAEMVLKEKGLLSSHLSNVALVCGFKAQGEEAWNKLHAGLQAVATASAQKRAQAFVKTISS